METLGFVEKGGEFDVCVHCIMSVGVNAGNEGLRLLEAAGMARGERV